MKFFESDVWRRTKDAVFLPPLKEVLSENGTGSYSRYTGFMVVLSVIVWVSFVVFKTHIIPDLTNPGIFMTLGAGTQYGIGQVKHMIAAAKGNQYNDTSDKGV